MFNYIKHMPTLFRIFQNIFNYAIIHWTLQPYINTCLNIHKYVKLLQNILKYCKYVNIYKNMQNKHATIYIHIYIYILNNIIT